jgi:hypothetical protein
LKVEFQLYQLCLCEGFDGATFVEYFQWISVIYPTSNVHCNSQIINKNHEQTSGLIPPKKENQANSMDNLNIHISTYPLETMCFLNHMNSTWTPHQGVPKQVFFSLIFGLPTSTSCFKATGLYIGLWGLGTLWAGLGLAL